ncbi:McrB family protein [Bacillus cereus group sp. BfR-BA-01352]|uniref:McrB family protein n=1 Tax=Bacillus cereus group sp. BfR-BA-01352 TaxID=2920315 RepID=UPI001F58F9ED|nr:AAA family ATPase [Bacillus cereus group sp. BfR-BA-01352]
MKQKTQASTMSKQQDLTKSKVKEILEGMKRDGTLGNEVVIRIEEVHKNTVSDGWRYLCYVLDPNDKFNEMKHPLNNYSWNIVFVWKEGAFKEGDVLIGQYKFEHSGKHMGQLLQIVPGTLKHMPRLSTLVDRHGDNFVNHLKDAFGGEEKIIGLIYERWLETVEIDMKEWEEKKETVLKEIGTLNSKFKEKEESVLKEIGTLNSKFKEKEEEFSGLENQITELKQKKKQLKNQIHQLKVVFGFEEGTDFEQTWNNETETYVFTEEEDFYKVLQRALYYYNDENLIYEYDVVKRFFTALQTDQLVLLTGPSGTGKSSLVNQVGQVMQNFKVHHVAVQSSWTDVQDLLGFFNPMKKCYLPTPFLEAIVEARNQEDVIHIICLDEMNLAHVEYYFSSFLSVREKHPNERYIDLYSERFYREAKSDLEALFQKPIVEITDLDIQELDFERRQEARNKYELLFYYPARFLVPSNVRFVGTLNMDETVKSLSPKVIDRSFIIELDHPTKLNRLHQELKENPFVGKIQFDAKKFISPAIEAPSLSPQQVDAIEKVIELADKLDSIPNARLNSRGRKHMERYVSCLPSIDGVVNQLLCSKVLPRIQFHQNDDEKRRVFQSFIDSLPSGLAKEKAERMKQGKRVIQFWG